VRRGGVKAITSEGWRVGGGEEKNIKNKIIVRSIILKANETKS
jgi:hypothetical protein